MAKAFNQVKREIELDDRINYGKYSGLTYRDLLSTDPDYILWAAANTSNLFSIEVIDEAVFYSFNTEQRNIRRERVLYTSSSVRGELPADIDFEDVPW